MADPVNVWGPLLSYPYYLGALPVAPTVDTLGVTLGVLHEGYIYWNNVSKNAWIWSGTAWILLATSAATSALLVAVTDAANYYAGVNAETVLQEVGLSLATLTTANGLRLAEIGALQRSAVESYAPRENTTPNMSILVDNLGVMHNGAIVGAGTAATVAISASDPINPRIDRVTVNYVTGGLAVTIGTPAAGPVAQAIPSGNFPVCQVRVNANVTTILNANITDERIIYSNKLWRGATVYRSVSIAIPTATDTAIPFTAELRDTDTIHDNAVNNTRLTVPAGVSVIKIRAQACFLNSSGVGYRRLTINKNGNNIFQMRGESTIVASTLANLFQYLESATLPVVPGDYFELIAHQTSGVSVDLDTNGNNSYFEMEIIQ